MSADPVGFLTPDEYEAIKRAGELWGVLSRVVGDGPTRDADLNELIVPIHTIQRYVMSNAAARAYPDTYRLLGEVGQWDQGEADPAEPASPEPDGVGR